MKKSLKILVAGVALVISLSVLAVACTGGNDSAGEKDRDTSNEIAKTFLANQPIPRFTFSQLRQTLIELNEAQATATATTTFFFNEGVDNPIDSCPSIGMPIATTAQLSNPEIVVKKRGEGGYTEVIPNMEPTGIYTGDSTGTYVLCVNAKGEAYANYWEGNVKTVTGVAEWDEEKHMIELVGPPSFEFTKKEGN